MPDPAVFQGALVDLKNVGTHKSVRLIVEVPEEYGEAIVRAFGWPTRVRPVNVAVARMNGEAPGLPEKKPEHRRFEDLSPAEQAGILCKEPDFAEFLRTVAPYCGYEGTADEAVRYFCNVNSRAYIKEGTYAYGQWSIILDHFRRWQGERDRLDIDF